ncbi:hypothetical protein DL546_007791 [Coniochaeta pulveracea]|uniref:G-patch domain-containing protein n=1 Tax=Coniochaeta pulveracea TaxID=177199 RepID=A0A420YK99_9PEZI|nr:hypothetical protein DL546_007791 [Coniochaeta pulveracea]
MNASALLQRQGWRGKGHTLHATDNSIGLTNPLLLSRNTDGSGIGANKQMTDQWWLAAFDEKLKGLDTSKKGVVVQSVTKGKLDAISSKGGKYSGLYLSFVRDTTPEQEVIPKKKESRAERRARKAAKIERRLARERERARKEELKRIKEAKKREGSGEAETKEERKARRAEARVRKEARRKRREGKAARKS